MDGRDMTLNLRLKPDDVVLVPEDGDLPVYVLGQVMKPGPYRWTRGMTVLDAVAQAGGIGRDGQSSKILVVRPGQNRRIVVSLSDVLAPEASMNVGVERGDIVFVPSSALADVGYFLEKLNAFSWIFVAQAVKK
jgi:polysaccharide export outer membrane protein